MSNPPNNPAARTPNSKTEASVRPKSASSTRPTTTSHSASTPPPIAAGLNPPATSKTVTPLNSSPPTTSSKTSSPVIATATVKPTQTTSSEPKSQLKSVISSKTNDNEKKTSISERQRSVIIDEKTANSRRSLADTTAQSLTNALASIRNKGEVPHVPSTPPQTPALSLSSSSPDLPTFKPSTMSTFTLPRTPPLSENTPPSRGGLDKAAMTTIREGMTSLEEAFRAQERLEQEVEANAREKSKGKTNAKEATKRGSNERRSFASNKEQSAASDLSNRSPADSAKPQEAKRSLLSDKRSAINEPRQITNDRQSFSNADRSKKTDARAMSPIDSTEPINIQMWSQHGNVYYFVPSVVDDDGKSIGSESSRTPPTKAPASAKLSTAPAPPSDHPRSTTSTASHAPAKVSATSTQTTQGTNASATSKTSAPMHTPDPHAKQRPSVLKGSAPKRISVTIKDGEEVEEYDEQGRRISCSETRRRKSVTYQPDGSEKGGQNQTDSSTERRKSALSSPPPTPTISQSPSQTLVTPPDVESPPPTPTDEALSGEMTKEHIRQGILSLAEYIPIVETPKSLQRTKNTTTSELPASDEVADSTRHTLAKMKSAPLPKSQSGNIPKGQAAKTPQKDNSTMRRSSKHTEKERPRSLGEGSRKGAVGASPQPRPSTVPQLSEERRKTIDATATHPRDGATAAPPKNKTQPETRRYRYEESTEHDSQPRPSGIGPGPDHLQHSARFPTKKYTDYLVTEDTSFFSVAGRSSTGGVVRKEAEDSKGRKTPVEGAESATSARRDSTASRSSNPPASTSRASNAPTTATLSTSTSRSSKGDPEKSTPKRRGSVAPD